MKVKVFTLSNIHELNDKWLDVVEICGTRVTCQFFNKEFGKITVIDFQLSEVIQFSYFKFNQDDNS